MRRFATRAAAVVYASLLVVACDINPFRLGTGDGVIDAGGGMDGNGGGNDGQVDRDGGGGDIDGGDVCVPQLEQCDAVDNDCDDNIDEDFDLDQDPANCGGCGNACNLPGAAGTCGSGTCSFECLPLFHDLNGDLGTLGSNGCEYGPCDGDSSTPEVCNLNDDDCDGAIDEDISGLDTDPMNCGSCFNQCIAVNVDATICVAGGCDYTACRDANGDGTPDFADLNPAIFGCEYACPVTPALAQEDCNGLDDDCDGAVDELPITGLGGDCGADPPGDVGECSLGTLECNLGVPACVGVVGPSVEVCDGLDNDCDGAADNGFDTQNDANNCGPGCAVCSFTNAIPRCNAGVCDILTCLPGFANPDGDLANGCEYACTVTGAEICDGQDNDCDTLTDEGVVAPAGLCNQNGACAGTVAQCAQDPCDPMSATQFRCIYGGDAETDGCGNLLFEETQCDLIDGDCDTGVDEPFSVGAACDDGGIGICQGTGNEICDPGDPTQTLCDITSPGQPPLANELCNARDDDCDALVDENAVDDMIGVDIDADTIIDFFIDMFEASRPDATPTSIGTVTAYACSNPGVLPWRTITWPEAEAACAAVGKRLCTQAEWQTACTGGVGNLYPYGNAYDPRACNGIDYDEDMSLVTDPGLCASVVNDEQSILPTGFDYGCPATPDTCVSALGVYDMSGNLQEWTGEVVGVDSRRVLGGSYTSIAGGLTCNFDFLSFDDTVAFPTLGFRCCVDAP